MAAHARMKIEFTEDEKYHILMTWLNYCVTSWTVPLLAWPGRSVGCASAWHADGREFDPRVRQHSFLEVGHEIISTAIASLPLIQVGQLSVTDLALVNHLESLPRNSVIRLTDRLDITIVVDWDVKL